MEFRHFLGHYLGDQPHEPPPSLSANASEGEAAGTQTPPSGEPFRTDMSLQRFAATRTIVEVAVPWADVTLFLVPGTAQVEQLVSEGIAPGRIWTAAEVLELFRVGVTREDVVKVGEAKLIFDGTVTPGVPPA